MVCSLFVEEIYPRDLILRDDALLGIAYVMLIWHLLSELLIEPAVEIQPPA